MSLELLQKYFPHLTEKQKAEFEKLDPLYKEWNEKINVISRKDMDSLYEKHILHSLGIAKIMEFAPKTKVLELEVVFREFLWRFYFQKFTLP